MLDSDNIIGLLKERFLALEKIEDSYSNLRKQMFPTYQDASNEVFYRKDRAEAVRRIQEELDIYSRYPPQHIRHKTSLDEFHKTSDFDTSIFIMTKFPERNNQTDKELRRVIKIVKDVVKNNGYTARIANEQNYHSMLWDNVELYLLGCKRGIAIVEDKYLSELNPNVAMEWGWMRGMGRDVLYLIEEDFNSMRADWSGLIEHKFKWSEPDRGIEDGINNWLKETKDDK